MKDRITELVHAALMTLNKNRECYVAQWILQNPNANIGDYTLVRSEVWEGCVQTTTFTMEKK